MVDFNPDGSIAVVAEPLVRYARDHDEVFKELERLGWGEEGVG